MSLGRALLDGSLQQAVYTGLTLVSQVVFAGLVARWVGPEAFGLFALGMAFNELLSVWTAYGAASSLSRRSVLSRQLVASVLAPMARRAALAVVIAAMLAWGYQFVEPRDGLLAVSMAVVCAGSLGQVALVLQAVSESRLEFLRVALGEAVSYWASTLCITLPLAVAGFEAWALILGYCGSHVVRALWHLPTVLRLPRTDAVEPAAPGFGRHLTLARIFNAGVQQTDRLLLGATGSIAAVGLYARAQSLAGQVSTSIGAVVDRVLYPALARVHARGDGSLPEHFHRIVGLVVVGVLPLALALAVVSEPVLAFVFGERWVAGAPVLAIAMGALPALAVIRVCDTVAQAVGRADRTAIMKAVYLAVLLPLLLAGATAGARGVAAAFLVAALVMMVVQVRDATVTAGAPVGAAVSLLARVAPMVGCVIVCGGGATLAIRGLVGGRGIAAITVPLLTSAISTALVYRLELTRGDSALRWMLAPIENALPAPLRRMVGGRVG